MRYIVELEIVNTESKERKRITVEKKLPMEPAVGHLIIINNEWNRIADIIQDADHGNIIVHCEPRYVSECLDEIVKKYTESDWKEL